MKQIIGIASDAQERAWIEKWQQNHTTEANLVEIIYEGLLLRPKILAFMEDTGLFDREVDGFVIHSRNYDSHTFNRLASELTDRCSGVTS